MNARQFESTDTLIAETSEQKDARMEWWRDARFGMFIHWGVYTIPAGIHDGKKAKGLTEWIMRNAKISVPEYGDIGVLWFDGEWIGDWTEPHGKALDNLLREIDPDLIINNRVSHKNDLGIEPMIIHPPGGRYGLSLHEMELIPREPRASE